MTWTCHLTGNLLCVQIRVVNSMGVPYAKHRGVAKDAVGVRVDSSRGMGVSGLPFMAVRCVLGVTPLPKQGIEQHCLAGILAGLTVDPSLQMQACIHGELLTFGVGIMHPAA